MKKAVADILSTETIPTLRCRQISQLPKEIDNIDELRLFQCFSREEDVMVRDEFVEYFKTACSPRLLQLVEKTIGLGVESENVFMLYVVFVRNCLECVSQENIDVVNTLCAGLCRHIDSTRLQTLCADCFDFVASHNLHELTDVSLFVRLSRLCFASFLSTLKCEMLTLIAKLIDVTSAAVFADFPLVLTSNGLDVSLLIQSSVLSEHLQPQCLDLVWTLFKKVSEQQMTAFLSTPPLPDYLIEAFLQSPSNVFLAEIVTLFRLTTAIARQIADILPITFDSFCLFVRLLEYLPPSTLSAHFQLLVDAAHPNGAVNDAFVDTLLVFLQAHISINISSVHSDIVVYLTNNYTPSHDVLLEYMTSPHNIVAFLQCDGLPLLLSLHKRNFIYKMLSVCYPTITFSLDIVPSSTADVLANIECVEVLCVVHLSLFGRCLVDSDIIKAVQPRDDVGVLFVASIEAFFKVDITVDLNSIVLRYGDAPFTQHISDSLLLELLQPKYENVLLTNPLLVLHSCCDVESHFDMLGFDDKMRFNDGVRWVVLYFGEKGVIDS